MQQSQAKIAEALDELRHSAAHLTSDPHLLERLVAVHDIVGDDLVWVDEALESLSAEGLRPATDAAQHLVKRGGKRVRPQAVLLAAACFGPVPPAARTIALVSELIHSATLLHDDVTDDGRERRGVPAARLVYGNAVSVLSGDLLLVHALERTWSDVPELMNDLLITLRDLVDGEVLQLRGRSKLDVSEATYDRILRGKTASLFAWSTRSGARVAGAGPEALSAAARFGELMGIAFQLVDDVLDYTGSDTGKGSLVDLREGKVTLPLVLAAQGNPKLFDTLRRIHGGDLDAVPAAARMVIESGACLQVRERALAVTDRAIETLTSLPVSPARRLLEDVARELARRAA